MTLKSDKLLILDLDETLIHASKNQLPVIEDFMLDAYYVHKRPYLDQFLVDISQHYSIGIWSSADDAYVEEMVNRVKPPSLTLEILWGRSRCSLKRDLAHDTYYFEKRLDKLKKTGFKPDQVIIVDDSPEKSRANYGNVIYIKEFTGNRNDRELLHLYDYLLTLKSVENIRAIEKRGWRSKYGDTSFSD
jgi:TFIIF-interacting CTD phosphatase-like protein